MKWEIVEDRSAFLPRSLPRWRPFSDTNPALERLAPGYHLGILSNIEDGFLLETLQHFTVSFEMIITAEQVRSYKPCKAHFEEAGRRKGNARWLHVAQSHFHDVVPALELGVPVAWVNRTGGPLPQGGGKPRCEVQNLIELADRLGV